MKIENATKSAYNSLIDKCFYSLMLKKAIIFGDCQLQQQKNLTLKMIKT